jgi:hypothetical protein
VGTAIDQGGSFSREVSEDYQWLADHRPGKRALGELFRTASDIPMSPNHVSSIGSAGFYWRMVFAGITLRP